MVFLYSSDRNYAPLSIISIYSLLTSNQDADEIKIYYIDNHIGNDYKEKLNSLISSYNRKIVYIDASLIDTSFITKTSFSISGYYRILITNMISEKKIIYLDCDTIIVGSFKKLWSLDLESYTVAGVKDTVQNYVATSIGMASNSFYLNSGFLYLNLEKCRADNFDFKVREYFKKFDGLIPHHDQGIINALANNSILYLTPEYNFQSQYFYFHVDELKQLFKIDDFYSKVDIENAAQSIVVIHFLNKFYGRPWEKNCTHPYLKLFDKIATEAGISDSIGETVPS